MTVTAEVVLDSVSPAGVRLTTFRLRYPKFVHGEFMTHRVFSRNASSSRAVPVSKNIEEVRSDALRATPISWPAEQSGMQGGEELTGDDLEYVEKLWAAAAISASNRAVMMTAIGLHKSVVNRVLEPFLHINVVATATEVDNFFGLRLDRAAQPEMRALAEAMWAARGRSEPRPLRPGEWHLPFVGAETVSGAMSHLVIGDSKFKIPDNAINRYCLSGQALDDAIEVLKKVSVARCARVSYESHETGRRSTVEEDLRLYDRLAASGHWSPFEHQATPDAFVSQDEAISAYGEGVSPCPLIGWQRPESHGNLRGWVQLRKQIGGEAVRPLPEGYGP